LHASDRTLFGNKAGATRLGFAVLLKMFQANGRFPYRLEEVPVAAVEAIASQIEVPAEAWRGYDWRNRAAAYQRAQIRDASDFASPRWTIPTPSRVGWKTRFPRWNTGQTHC
jgi:hypothetical protein